MSPYLHAAEAAYHFSSGDFAQGAYSAFRAFTGPGIESGGDGIFKFDLLGSINLFAKDFDEKRRRQEQKQQREIVGTTKINVSGFKFANGADTYTYENAIDSRNTLADTLTVDTALDVLLPGYDLYQCATEGGCSGFDIFVGVVGIIPGGKVATGAFKIGSKIFKGGRKGRQRFPCSFVAGTLVATPRGLVSIEELNVGDLVFSKDDEGGGSVQAKRINAVFVENHSEVLQLEVETERGVSELIITTAEHPFKVLNSDWIAADSLRVGEILETLDSGIIKVKDTKIIQEAQPAYNFEVDEFHTYAVGESEVWVHNTCGYIPPPNRIEGIPDLSTARPKTPVQGGGGLRKRWKDRKGNIYEWDSQHGTLEKYNKRGRHVGEFDPTTGEKLKNAVPTRRVEP